MSRFRIIFWISILSFGFILYRLFLIQIFESSRNIPLQKYLQVNKEVPVRGEIYDRHGQPLTLNRKTYNLYVNSQALRKKKKIQQVLKQELNIKKASLSAVLKSNKWPKLKSQISEDKKNKLTQYYPHYVNFEEEWVRYYPESSSAAHLLGFVGYDSVGQPKGYVGLEGYYDQELQGRPVIREQESDLLGIPFIGGLFTDITDLSGLDLELTIDLNVQKIVESHLADGVKRYGAKQGCAIVLEPNSGKLLALGCIPAFDPKKYYDYEEKDFVNPLVGQLFEPGSTFKPLIVAMALEEKKIKPKSVFPEKGPYQIGGYAIRTWDDQYRGKVDVQEILEKSSNVGMVHIIKTLSEKKVEQYFNKLGFKELTGIELEGEANSLFKQRSEWYPIDFATYSFGQGLAITPIQLVRAFTTLTNNGYLVKPTILQSIVDRKNKQNLPKQDSPKKQVFSPRTTKQMRKILYNAVENSEAIWPNKPEGYRFCGKTGTAQIPVKGQYDPSKTIASFIGFLPCDKPKFLLFTMYREPRSSPWGSETAAPTFFEIANSLILYYNIAPQSQ